MTQTNPARALGGAAFVDENWQQVPLYTVDDDVMLTCSRHGEFCPAAYYDDWDISEMMQTDGEILCPLCLDEITGGC